MFEGEVQTAGIQMEFVLTDSFTSLGVDWVKIDPSRVLQVSGRVHTVVSFVTNLGAGAHQPYHKRHQVYNN